MRTKRVELKNNHKNDYNQVIHGERYLIKSGESINLSRRQAVDVRGHYAQGEKGEDIEVSLELIPIPDAVSAEVKEAPKVDSDIMARLQNLEAASKGEKVKIYACVCEKEYTDKGFYLKHLAKCEAINGRHDSSADTD